MAAKQLRKRHKNGNLEPFISVDSATIHESLAESILFGHEKGAFTGALQSKKGLFEEANGGILYFDEIANMSIDIQKKLLRVIQEKEVLRVGSNIRIPVEIRIVAATNKSLEVLVKQGDFLEDLFQRISVLPLKIPALRERTEDIPELLNYFAKKNAIDGRVLSFSKPAIELLQKYDWPGNIRELANLVAYLSVVLEHGEIGPDNLPEKITQSVKGLTKDTHSIEKPIENSEMIPDPKTIAKDFDRLKFSYEKRLLQELYNFSNGNVTSIARALNADRPTLHLKLVTMGIHKPKTLNQNIFN
jgi:DNA-binding NtrC family response regulator